MQKSKIAAGVVAFCLVIGGAIAGSDGLVSLTTSSGSVAWTNTTGVLIYPQSAWGHFDGASTTNDFAVQVTRDSAAHNLGSTGTQTSTTYAVAFPVKYLIAPNEVLTFTNSLTSDVMDLYFSFSRAEK